MKRLIAYGLMVSVAVITFFTGAWVYSWGHPLPTDRAFPLTIGEQAHCQISLACESKDGVVATCKVNHPATNMDGC